MHRNKDKVAVFGVTLHCVIMPCLALNTAIILGFLLFSLSLIPKYAQKLQQPTEVLQK